VWLVCKSPSDTRTIHPPAWLDGHVYGAGCGVVDHLESQGLVESSDVLRS
jgi:hypothetical protein